MSAAPAPAEASSRLRSYHAMPDQDARRGPAPGQVIQMPSLVHLSQPVVNHGALAAKIAEPTPVERPVLDALIEASLNRDLPISPIMTEVTEVEPIEEWAPAPGLDADDEPRSPVSSLEDIQRFLDQSRQQAYPAPSTGSMADADEPRDIMPELSGEDDDHPTENADVNVPMITQWWTRKS